MLRGAVPTWCSYVRVCSINVGEAPRVKTAASLFHKLCYRYRDHLVAGIICAGWDPVEGGQVCVCACVHVQPV